MNGNRCKGPTKIAVQMCVCVCVYVCTLTGHDSEVDGGHRENSPGCCVLGVADVVSSAVALQ